MIEGWNALLSLISIFLIGWLILSVVLWAVWALARWRIGGPQK